MSAKLDAFLAEYPPAIYGCFPFELARRHELRSAMIASATEFGTLRPSPRNDGTRNGILLGSRELLLLG